MRRGGRPCVFRGHIAKLWLKQQVPLQSKLLIQGAWRGCRGGGRTKGWPLYLPSALSPSQPQPHPIPCRCHGAALPPAHLTPGTFEPLAPPLCSLRRYPLEFQSPKSQVLPKRVEGSPVHSAVATEATSPAPHSTPATSARPQAVRVGSRVNSELGKPLCSPGLGRPL